MLGLLDLLDLLFPSRCLTCGASGDVVCNECRQRLPLLAGPVCSRCGSPAGERCLECRGRALAFASATSAVAYRKDIARVVAAWKEGGAWRLTAVAALVVTQTVPPPKVDALTSVPPDRDRALWRGHDPAEALGRALARAKLEPALSAHAATPRAGRGSEGAQRERTPDERRSKLSRGAWRSTERRADRRCVHDWRYRLRRCPCFA